MGNQQKKKSAILRASRLGSFYVLAKTKAASIAAMDISVRLLVREREGADSRRNVEVRVARKIGKRAES